ncbi:hypothetical protein B0H17DRAFT_1151639 [Mycena rosella]|uniref:Uncharacterized protein n=1 Tax=Mycena rosella TaxID=1033263 RepID=A0AAD7FGF0_MYCRO|nr:hypothetical protein B0H17DRAFT_1151639 [Mycena rosella]
MGQNFESPGSPVAPAKARKLHRNGYEATPQTPSLRPFALNNTSAPRRKAFDITNPTPLDPIPTLDPSEWKELALESHAIPMGANLHSFQVNISNLVVRSWVHLPALEDTVHLQSGDPSRLWYNFQEMQTTTSGKIAVGQAPGHSAL